MRSERGWGFVSNRPKSLYNPCPHATTLTAWLGQATWTSSHRTITRYCQPIYIRWFFNPLMFYKYAQAKAVLRKFTIPHKDTLFVHAEYAEGKTESCLSGFNKYILMRLTGFYSILLSLEKWQMYTNLREKAMAEARGLTTRTQKLITDFGCEHISIRSIMIKTQPWHPGLDNSPLQCLSKPDSAPWC